MAGFPFFFLYCEEFFPILFVMSSHQFSCYDYLSNEQVCKILSEDQNIIDIITENLLNVYENIYMCDSFEILRNGVSIMYKPRLENHSALPPIIL